MTGAQAQAPQVSHAMPQSPAGGGHPSAPDAGTAPPRKHRTIIGELSLESIGSSVITIGRTPDNQIVVPHAQVSSKHAQIVKEGNNLFLVDLGSANGTYVRGQRIPPNQRVPVQNDEQRLHRPDAAGPPHRGEPGQRRHRRPGRVGGEAHVRDRSVGPVPPGARPRSKGGDEDPPRSRQLQGAAGRHDRADGAERRRQDDAAPHAQRLPAADERAGAHQRRRPLPHLRRPPRLDRLRPAGRHRPPRADRLRGGAVLGEVPLAARLQRGGDQPSRRRDAARPRPRGREEPDDRQARERRSSPAGSGSA